MLARRPPLLSASMQVRDLAAMVGIEAGDYLEFDHIGALALSPIPPFMALSRLRLGSTANPGE